MEKNKTEQFKEQVNKIEEVLAVLKSHFSEDFADDINYLEIVKNDISEAIEG